MRKLPLRLLYIVFALSCGSIELKALHFGQNGAVSLERRQADETSFCQRLVIGGCDVHCQWRVWMEFLVQQYDGIVANFSSFNASFLSAITGGAEILKIHKLVGCLRNPHFWECSETPRVLDVDPSGPCGVLLRKDLCVLPGILMSACSEQLSVLSGLPFDGSVLDASHFSTYGDQSGITDCTPGHHFNHTSFTSEAQGVQQLVDDMDSNFNVSKACGFLVKLATGTVNSSIAQNQIQAGCSPDRFSDAFDDPDYCIASSNESGLSRETVASIVAASCVVMVAAVGVLVFKWPRWAKNPPRSELALNTVAVTEEIGMGEIPEPEEGRVEEH